MTTLSRKKWRKMGLWLVGSTGLTLMVAWNWKLVLATTTGVSLMILVYQIEGENWQRRWLYYREFIKGFSGKLTIAVMSGGFGAIGTYLAASIWTNVENRWLAIGAIVQGVGTLLTLGLLLWQICQVKKKNDENQFSQWVSDLTSTDSLKRLIAIRNLSNLLKKQGINNHYYQEIREYFQLMLAQETETLVRQGILEGLQVLSEKKRPDFKKVKVINVKQKITIKNSEIV